jgi:hypothetical protein
MLGPYRRGHGLEDAKVSEGERDATRGRRSWTLEISLPVPDRGAVEHLTALLTARTDVRRVVAGTTTLSVVYPTEADARAAMVLVRADMTEVRCRVEASPVRAGD